VTDWDELEDWWLSELADDPIYALDVIPLALDLVGTGWESALDLGCGEGQVMGAVAGNTMGTDVSQKLLARAAAHGPVVRGRLPNLNWLRPASIDVAFAVLVLEHLPNLDLFEQVRRVVRPGGHMVVVANHPAFTAADAGPILDQTDGEFLWRWGSYFDTAPVPMHAGGQHVITFHHRPLGEILNAAADAGWALDRLCEVGFSTAAIEARPGYAGQETMPRLAGFRWTNPAAVRAGNQHSR
jgi:SAM-dependent methyltransferase